MHFIVEVKLFDEIALSLSTSTKKCLGMCYFSLFILSNSKSFLTGIPIKYIMLVSSRDHPKSLQWLYAKSCFFSAIWKPI